MNLSELNNPYCIIGLIIFVIIIAISIYYKFISENFTITIPVTKEMNDTIKTSINNTLNDINSMMNNKQIIHIYSKYIGNLQDMLNARNIHITEAYPYLPLYGILLYNDNDNNNKSQFDDSAFTEAVDIELSNNLIIKNMMSINSILTNYIYMLVTYKNYVPYQYVNSSLNSNYILDNDYKTLFDADYVQFMKEVNEFKNKNNDLDTYKLLINYIYNYNQNIGDEYEATKIGMTIDIIKSYMDNTTFDVTDKYKLSKIYTELNYINNYLTEFKTYVDDACNYMKNTVNIFTKTSVPTSTTTEGPTSTTTEGPTSTTTEGPTSTTTEGPTSTTTEGPTSTTTEGPTSTTTTTI